MPIKYVLSESPFSTTDPDAHVARVLRTSTSDLDDVMAIMAQQGCTIFKSDVKAVLEAFHSAIEFLLLEGYSVNAESARYRVGIGGTFAGSEDTFDPDRHQVRIHIQPGKRIRQALEHAEWEKVEPHKPLPHPMHYTDIASGTRDETATPGGVGQVNGYRLRFDPADLEQGVFLAEQHSADQHPPCLPPRFGLE